MRSGLTLSLALTLCLPAYHAGAQAYPSKPIRLIDPFPPGGGSGVMARMIGQKLSETWGQPVVVDNRAGAGGALGSELVARSAPNGYMLLMATAGTAVSNPLLSNVPFDPLKDFAPVVQTTSVQLMLATHPSLPVRSVKEFVALARAQPGKINFASAGNGTFTHLSGELFKAMAKVDIVHVPYRGGGPAMADLLGGQVQVTWASLVNVLPHTKTGKLRPVAVTGSRRALAAPELPTIAESGLPGYEVIQWYGVLAPAATPDEVIDKLNREINAILSLPEIRMRTLSSGAEPAGGTPQQFATMLKTEITKWAKVIKDMGIRID